MLELKRKQYPAKTTVNLVMRERSAHQIARGLCMFGILLVLAGLFSKFAVSDRLAVAARVESAAQSAESRLEQLKNDNSAYESVRVEYARYFSDEAASGELGYADCMEVLSLVESKLMQNAGVASAAFDQNVLTVKLTGTDLEQASAILADLYQSDLVSTVEIYTADADEENAASRANIAMTITLISEGGRG